MPPIRGRGLGCAKKTAKLFSGTLQTNEIWILCKLSTAFEGESSLTANDQ